MTRKKLPISQISLYLLHGFNLAWIARIFLIRLNSGIREPVYLADPILIGLLFMCIFLHLIRWKIYMKLPVDTAYSSSILLRIAIREVATKLYASIPYFISPIPNENLLAKQAEKTLKEAPSIEVKTNHDLFNLLLQIPGFKAIHVGVAFFSLSCLYFGGFPNSISILKGIWIADPLLVCIASNLFIYSCATIFLFKPHHASRK